MSGQKSRRPGSPPPSVRGFGPVRATKTFGPGSPPDAPGSPSVPSTALCDPGKKRPMSSTAWTEKPVSPSCTGFSKEKKPIRNSAETIRRSASFDTIASSYLSGEWPWPCHRLFHPNLVHCPIVLTADRWTQTSDDSEELEVDSPLRRQQLNQRHLDSSCANCGFVSTGFREIRPRLCHSARVSPLLACTGGYPSSAIPPRSRAIAIPAAVVVVGQRNPFVASCQGSVEGFNQEIEKLVHSTGASDSYLDLSKTRATTPDGHRAPIANLLNIRSVNTQTPSGGGLCHSGIEKHFQHILEDSDDSPSLPMIPGAGDTSLLFNRPTSAESDNSDACERVVNGSVSPASFIPLKTSKRREAPEGCEKTEAEFGKTNEAQIKKEACRGLPSPMETNGIFKCLIPSERSAFCPLFKKYVSQQTHLSFTLSDENDTSIEAK